MLIKKVFVRMLTLGTFALLLSGCGGMPKNAEEFRQGALNSPFKNTFNLVETYEVARPFPDVSATLQKRAKECLALTYDWTVNDRRYVNTRSGTTTYKPTFIASAKRAEVHVQKKSTGTIEIGAPEAGGYRIVLDATPLAKNRTRIVTYASSAEADLFKKAMRGWVTGDNPGCPDLINK